MLTIDERFLTNAVAHEQQHPIVPVPQCQGEHRVHHLERSFRSVLGDQLDQNLGVGSAAQPCA